MKKSKKFLKVLSATAIAAIMATSMMSTTAFAVNVPLTDQTVTMPSTVSNLTFDVYKVATAAYDDANGAGYYTYTIESDFSSVANFAVDTYGRLTYNSKVLDNSNNSDVAALAAALKAAVSESTTKAAADLAPGATENLAPGYYLILSKGELIGAPILTSVTNSAVTIPDAKTSTIVFDKSITGITNGTLDKTGTTSGKHDTAEGAVGSVVSYTITTNFPKYSTDLVNDDGTLKDGVNLTDFTITDVPSKGLTIGDTITVKVDGTTADSTQYTITKDATDNAIGGRGFTLVFDDQYVYTNANKPVTVEFTATVTDESASKTAIQNDADLVYGNNFETGTGEGSKHDDTEVYRINLDIYKYYEPLTSAGSEMPLAGAGFTIYKSVDGAKGDPISGERTTGADGKIMINDLPAGKYIIEETTVPAGYKKAADVNVEVVANFDATNTNEYDGTYTLTGFEANGEVKIANVKGQTLPGTGGVGTTMFTIGGIALVLVAGAMLTIYMKKRKTAE